MGFNDIHFKSFPQMESPRLIFRKLVVSDAVDIQFIRSNSEVMKFMDSNPHKTIKDSEKFITDNLNRYKNKTGIFWAIIEKSKNTFIGDFAYWNILRQDHRAEIGYTLKPEYWEKGYMSETLSTLIKFGFEGLNLHSIQAEINPSNINSEKVLQKIGFKKEAHFKENRYFNGKYLNSDIYSLLESDFVFKPRSIG